VCSVVQLYCAQWLGEDHMLCGGTAHNLVRIINRHTLEVQHHHHHHHHQLVFVRLEGLQKIFLGWAEPIT